MTPWQLYAGARLLAESLGMQVRGSLGVVLWAVGQRHLTRAQGEDTLARLAASSLWVSPRVLAEARAALDRLGRTQKTQFTEVNEGNKNLSVAQLPYQMLCAIFQLGGEHRSLPDSLCDIFLPSFASLPSVQFICGI